MVKIICDRCGAEVKDTNQDDNFIQYGHTSEFSNKLLYKKSLDLCADCMIEFRRWLKHENN